VPPLDRDRTPSVRSGSTARASRKSEAASLRFGDKPRRLTQELLAASKSADNPSEDELATPEESGRDSDSGSEEESSDTSARGSARGGGSGDGDNSPEESGSSESRSDSSSSSEDDASQDGKGDDKSKSRPRPVRKRRRKRRKSRRRKQMRADPDPLLLLGAAAPFGSNGGQRSGTSAASDQGNDAACTRERRRGVGGETASLLRPGATSGWS
jgi:hypothetical protein